MTNPLEFLAEQLGAWRKAGTYQPLRVLESESAPVSRFDGREVINLASNNYLGLTTHPRLREAALEATRKHGVGSGAVRTISGTMSIHMQLEQRLCWPQVILRTFAVLATISVCQFVAIGERASCQAG